MLVISSGNRSDKRVGSWHVGETMYIPKGPVITFQADGHELAVVMDALLKAGIKIVYPADHLTPIL